MAVSHVKSDTIADFTGTITGFNSQGSTTLISATDLVRPVDWNSAHNQFYTLTGNTTGNSTASGTNVLFAGSGGISIGGSTGTVVWSVRDQLTVSFFPEPYPQPLATSSMVSGTTGASSTTFNYYLAPMVVYHDIHYNNALIYASGGTAAGTGSWSGAHIFGLYTLNGGTAFSLLTSWIFNAALSQNSVSAQSVRVYWGTNSTSNSTSWGGNSSASFTGWREALLFTGTSTLTNGVYYAVHGFTHRTSGASVGGMNSAAFVSYSQTTGGAKFGTNTTIPYVTRFIGSFSTTTTGTTTGPTAHGMPGSINTSALTFTGGSSQYRWPIVHLR